MYNHNVIEKKWQKIWEKEKVYNFFDDVKKKKYFALNEFPYPSGTTLHNGHAMGMSFIDIHARYKNSQGYCVLCPIGWDAFGLPAEQFAIKNNQDPNIFTSQNIEKMKNQIKTLGTMFAWNKEINTTDPQYYAITQWIFGELFKAKLAVLQDSEVNWCEQMNTVLANDEIVIKDGKMFSERGDYPVVKKNMKQWILKITEYAQKLVDTLNEKTWRSSVVQKQWIGISKGAMVNFETTSKTKLTVFTTRIDTIYGVSFIVVAPENDLAWKLTTNEHMQEVVDYIELTKSKTELERKENKTKTGVFTGSYAINPFTKKQIPIYIADYVLNNYGTGVVMGVPAHDQRDWEFAKKYKLEIIPVIKGCDVSEQAEEKDGVHCNSGIFDGLKTAPAIKKGLTYIQQKKIGTAYTTTKLHDWTFSRQRYWGEPFPIIYDSDGNPTLVDESKLPVVLPKLEDYSRMQSSDGVYHNPLDAAKDWVNVIINNKEYTRETNTMPGSAGSSDYWMCYILKNDDGSYTPINSIEGQKRLKRWLPVDVYCGGNEHTTGHVLYARFWHRFLFDKGYVKSKDFFKKRIDHGIVLAEDGKKISKRDGNGISPTDIVASHGADALRCAISFMGPIDAVFPWNSATLDGIRKWLDRVYTFFEKNVYLINKNSPISDNMQVAYNVFVKNVEKNLEEAKHNLAISDMQIFINECYKEKKFSYEQMVGFLTVLSFFAPHIAEEINHEILKNNTLLFHNKFPTYNPEYTVSKTLTLPIQINGKVRGTIEIDVDASKEYCISKALKNVNVKKYIINGQYKKVIYVKNKILNFIL